MDLEVGKVFKVGNTRSVSIRYIIRINIESHEFFFLDGHSATR